LMHDGDWASPAMVCVKEGLAGRGTPQGNGTLPAMAGVSGLARAGIAAFGKLGWRTCPGAVMGASEVRRHMAAKDNPGQQAMDATGNNSIT